MSDQGIAFKFKNDDPTPELFRWLAEQGNRGLTDEFRKLVTEEYARIHGQEGNCEDTANA